MAFGLFQLHNGTVEFGAKWTGAPPSGHGGRRPKGGRESARCYARPWTLREVLLAEPPVSEVGAATDREELLKINRRFYQALCALDLEAMDDIWLDEKWVRCVHPGWMQLEGWEAVRESWERIFENTQFLRVTINQVFIHQEGDLAWVSCIEKVSSTGEGRIDSAYLQSTNLFVRRDDRWRMVLHHSSHLPASVQPGEKETVQ